VDELLKMRLMRQSGGTVPEQYETTLIRKDGMPLIVELGTRVIEYAGKPALSVVIRDVTKRKQAEEALRHSEEYFRALTENVLDVIVVLNRDASVRYKSPSFEQMVGKDRASKKPFEFVHPDDIPNATETFAQLTQNPGATVHTEIRGQHRDGSWHTFEVIGKNLLDDPAVAGIVANFRDITERKLAEQEVHRLNEELEQRVIERTTQLQAVNKELEAFAYSVSHDLRAPLRSIDGFSQILMEDYTDKLDDEGKDYLQRVRSASQRMGELIDDILSLSRVTRGEMRYESVDLSALAETIRTELQQSQPERQVEFTTTPGLVARGDSHLLRAALDNLLGNAWKFTKTRAPARLEFGMVKNNGQLAYFVRDNGVGFDMAYADKLFGAFQRLHSPSEFEGTGIGLATVQRIIHRHGGNIWAESVVDQGTTFYFTL
jgi:PAS domain S-box-containing protein